MTRSIRSLFTNFADDTNGATAIEYALMAGLFAIGIVASGNNVSSELVNLFGTIGSEYRNAGS